MGDPVECGTYCQRIDGLLKLEASRENAFILSGAVQRSEMTPEGSVLWRYHRPGYCCMGGSSAELLFLMAPYVSVDRNVHHPLLLSAAVFHRRCIMGENKSASSCARTS